MVRIELFQQMPDTARSLKRRLFLQSLFQSLSHRIASFFQFLLSLRPYNEIIAVQLVNQLGGPLRIGPPHGPDALLKARDGLLGVRDERVQGSIRSLRVGIGQVAPAVLPFRTRQSLRMPLSVKMPAGYVPEENGAIVAGGGKQAAIRRKNYLRNPMIVSTKAAALLSGGDLP